jgi:hypothetical protein
LPARPVATGAVARPPPDDAAPPLFAEAPRDAEVPRDAAAAPDGAAVEPARELPVHARPAGAVAVGRGVGIALAGTADRAFGESATGSAPRPPGTTGVRPAAGAVVGFTPRAAALAGHGTRCGSAGREADCLSAAWRGLTAGAAVFVPLDNTRPGHGTRWGIRTSVRAVRGVRVGAAAVAGLPLLKGTDREAPVYGAAVPPARFGVPAAAPRVAYWPYPGCTGAGDGPASGSPRRYRATAVWLRQPRRASMQKGPVGPQSHKPVNGSQIIGRLWQPPAV